MPPLLALRVCSAIYPRDDAYRDERQFSRRSVSGSTFNGSTNASALGPKIVVEAFRHRCPMVEADSMIGTWWPVATVRSRTPRPNPE